MTISSELTVVSWNTKNQLNDPNVQRAILDHEPHVAIIPEAADESEGISTATQHMFANAGYDLHYTPNNDNDQRTDRRIIAVAVRPELVRHTERTRLSGRTTLRLTLTDDMEVTAVHLDDRTERRRVAQTWTVLSAKTGASSIIAGDFNAMYRDDMPAPLLRAARPLVHLLPTGEPGREATRLRRVGSLGRRLTDMAAGKTMDTFMKAGYTDADMDHQPTVQMGSVGVQLDHILYRGDIVTVEPTTVHPTEISDHRLLRAVLATGDTAARR